MAKQEKRYFFRVQYQIGAIEISEKVEGYGYLSVSSMIMTILKLVMKVKDEIDEETGGKVALKGLRLIFNLCHNVNMDWQGTGGSQSKYLNLYNAKDKAGRSERFDVEFLGIGGKDDLSNEAITKFIASYKKLVRGEA